MNKYIVALIAMFIGFYYVCPPAFDLSRYYETAESFNTTVSVLSFSLDYFDKNFDFIYFTTFFLVKKIGLYKECVTALFMGLYYSQLIYFLELSEKSFKLKRKSDLVLIEFFAIFSVTPMYTLSISRNAAALSIFFVGLCYLLRQKKLITNFCLLFSLFTHVVMFIYLVVFYLITHFKVFYIGQKIRIPLLIIATVLGLNSKKWLNIIFDLLLKLPFFSIYERYSGYISDEGETNALNDNSTLLDVLPYTDSIPIIYNILLLLFGLIFLKKYSSPIIFAAYFFYIFLIISFGFSCMWVQRTIMLIMPFQGVIALALLNQKRDDKTFCLIYKTMLLISIVMCFLNLFSYRELIYLSF